MGKDSMHKMQLYIRLFSQCLFQVFAGNSHQVTFGHFHTKFLYRTVKFRKLLHLQICYVLCGLPTPSLGITSYSRTNTLKRGIVKKAKRGMCVLVSTVHIQSLGSAHLTAPQCYLIHPPDRKMCSTWLPLERHSSGVVSRQWQDGSLELCTYEWFPKSLQLRTKRSLWVGGKQVPVHNSGHSRAFPLF